MAEFIRSIVMFLSCTTVLGLSSSAAQAAEMPHHAGQRHSHQQHHHDVQELSISAQGRIQGMVRREAADEEEEQEMHMQRYATSPTPRPFASALQAEPHVSCGKHVASECAACVLQHGPDWCHGDCKWDGDTEKCVTNDETTVVSTTSQKYATNSESDKSDDAIARKLKEEEEAAEEQERIDRNKFWVTVGISAGASALLIMCCGVFAICFVFKRNVKGKEAPKFQASIEEVGPLKEALLLSDLSPEELMEDDETPYDESNIEEEAIASGQNNSEIEF